MDGDGDRDPLIRQEERAEAESTSRARLFDIRRIIGGLFLVYGVVVTTAGLLDSKAQLDKAQGIRINLWAGLAMLLLGAFFLTWMLLRPVTRPAPDEPDRDDRPGRRPD